MSIAQAPTDNHAEQSPALLRIWQRKENIFDLTEAIRAERERLNLTIADSLQEIERLKRLRAQQAAALANDRAALPPECSTSVFRVWSDQASLQSATFT